MKSGRGFARWCYLVGTAAAAVLGAGLVLRGAPPAKQPAAQGRQGQARGTSADDRGQVLKAGEGIPQELTVQPPLKADYRKDAAEAVYSGGGLTVIGPPAPGFVPPVGDEMIGTTAAGSPCTAITGEECSDCNYCTVDTCESGKCVNTNRAQGTQPRGCNDGLYCNGQEECDGAGGCVAGTPPSCPGQVCEEGDGTYVCVNPCSIDADCNDGLDCTDDTCDTQTGRCLHTNACGPGAECSEPGPSCPTGRCCDGAGTCTTSTYADCTGAWLATDSACVEVQPSGNLNDCPNYASGIAPQGTFVTEVGPISGLDCDTLSSIGDDYTTVEAMTSDYIEVQFLRFAGGVLVDHEARWNIAFYDERSGTPLFIEDTFWPDGSNDSADTGSTIKTVDFDPPMIIPTTGIVVFSVQQNFGIQGRVTLLSTDAVDVGANDPDRMWVNGGMIEAADAGPLAPGDRVLAFELVGRKAVPEPLGACCNSLSGTCTMELPWVCEDQGNVFQGVGTLCAFCSNKPDRTCQVDGDCPACVGGNNPGAYCDQDNPCDGGTCTGTASCLLVPPACLVSACCDKATGDCTEISTGSCSGTVCSNDAFITGCTSDLECPTNGTCVDITGRQFQGFGTNCDPNCCSQPLPKGADACADVELQVINVPTIGEWPITVTLSENNSAATFVEYDQGVCDDFSPEGQSPPWWQGFSITDCANVRVDMCCTDISGEPLRPAWGNLWKGCPCGDITSTKGVEPPLGIGRGTSGWARGDPFCNEDNLWMTFGPLRKGTYYYPIYAAPDGTAAVPPGADYQFHVTVAACPLAACCTGEVCQVTNEIECADLGGHWLAFENVPENVITCDFSPCAIGSCCMGPGDCDDRADPNIPCDRNTPETCIDKVGCDIRGGTYVGGAACDFPTSPCPICAIAGDTNCQSPSLAEFSFVMTSDLAILPSGVTTADDFVPQTETPITSVCTWGAYHDGTDCVSGDGPGCDCISRVTDDFRVTVYGDAGGYPDSSNVIGTSTAGTVYRGQVAAAYNTAWTDTQLYEFQLELDTPISGFTAGQRYWLEIVNNTVESDRCNWHWAHTALSFNDVSFSGDSKGYSPGGARKKDMAFCLNINLDSVPPIDGTCCSCPSEGPTCSGPTALSECRAGDWDQTEVDCANVTCASQDPVPGDVCVDGLIPITGNVSIATNNTCSTTDGPVDPVVGLAADIWYAYTADCTGRVTVSMCATGNFDNSYDSALGVYKDTNDRTHCPCPNDLGWTRIGSPSDMDEGCDGLNDGGSGIIKPPPVLPGDCLTVRVGGFEGARGRGHLSISCQEVSCFLAAAPVIPTVVDEVTLAGAQNTATTGDSIKNRFISFTGGDPGKNEAVRVTFDSLPAPYDIWNGQQLWVSSVREVCENAGSVEPPPTGCPNAPGLPKKTFWAATLSCDSSAAVYADWTTYDLPIHIYNEGIVPGGQYSIQFIDDTCDLGDPDNFSSPTQVTQAKWGDLVENCGKDPCGAPNGVVGVATDVTAVLDKFKNLPGAPIKSRADLAGIPPNDGEVDLKIQIIDVTWCLNAFVGGQYGFAPGDPCDGAVAMK